MPIPFLIPAIIAGASALVSGIGGAIQGNKNRKAAQKIQREQASANEQYLAQQNEYNSPASQMQRFQDARLNPNLIYGQGNPGNQSAPLEYPSRREEYQNLGDIAPQALQAFNQTTMTQAQVQAVNANTLKANAQQSLIKMQTAVLARNPLMDDNALKAIIDGLITTADIKTTEWNMGLSKLRVQQSTEGMQVAKLGQEIELLSQKFDLGTQDQSVKAEIIKSKEFQNAILEVQKKFMTDAQMTPQHVLQFIQLLLMKIL